MPEKEGIMNQKYSSANTSINSTKLPAIYKLRGGNLKGKKILDIGGGKYDNAKVWASENGSLVSIYDKFNRSEEENREALSVQEYDVSILSNVLNVIQESEIRKDLIMLALNKAPVVYVTVYEGNGTGIGAESKRDCWQENRKTGDYVTEILSYAQGCSVTKKGKVIEIRREVA